MVLTNGVVLSRCLIAALFDQTHRWWLGDHKKQTFTKETMSILRRSAGGAGIRMLQVERVVSSNKNGDTFKRTRDYIKISDALAVLRDSLCVLADLFPHKEDWEETAAKARAIGVPTHAVEAVALRQRTKASAGDWQSAAFQDHVVANLCELAIDENQFMERAFSTLMLSATSACALSSASLSSSAERLSGGFRSGIVDDDGV